MKVISVPMPAGRGHPLTPLSVETLTSVHGIAFRMPPSIEALVEVGKEVVGTGERAAVVEILQDHNAKIGNPATAAAV